MYLVQRLLQLNLGPVVLGVVYKSDCIISCLMSQFYVNTISGNLVTVSPSILCGS